MNNNNNEAPKKGSKMKTVLKWIGFGAVVAGGTYVLATNKWGSRDKVVSGTKSCGNWVKGLFTKNDTTTVVREQPQEMTGCIYQQPQREQQPAQRNNFERREDRRDQRREFNNNSYKH